MDRATAWQHSSNSNIKIIRNSIEPFLRNPSGFSSDDVLSCLWIVFTSYAWGIQVFCSRNEVAPHFSNRTLEYLKQNLPWDRLISCQTDNPWPSYSEDLNPPDYFLRGKDRVCENNAQTR